VIVARRAAARLRRLTRDVMLERFALRDPPAQRILRRLARARLVTFDVFDSALLRGVAEPADVFALTAWRHGRRFGRQPEVERFVAARRDAETAARAAAQGAGRSEVTLAEIYAALAREPGWARDDAAALQDEEIAAERAVSMGNPAFLRLCASVRAHGGAVAFLSDTYLPEELIASLLRAGGYPEPLRVFTSAAFGVTKAAGTLFAAVARREKLAVRDLAHIGDNPVADVRNARRAGVTAFWYRRPSRTHRPRHGVATDERGLAASLASGFAAAGSHETTAHALAADVAAPLYLGFAQWLSEALSASQPDAVLFCARDGLVVKRVYDRLRAFYPAAPPSTYFLISRRTLVFPSFTHLGERELDFLCGNPLPMSPQSYLERIGFEAARFEPELAAAGLHSAQPVTTAQERRALRRFFTSIADAVLAAAASERSVLLRYLDELGCAVWSRIAICDIGWHGSLQRALTDVLRSAGREIPIDGYYVGLSDRVAPEAAPSMRGWLWRPGDGEQAMRTQSDGREVVEMLFTARHPTVIGRACDGARTSARFDHAAELDANNRAAAAAIQNAALTLIDTYVAVFDGLRPAQIARDDVYARVVRLIERPRADEIAFLGRLVHVAGFGTTRSGQPLAQPPPVLEALRHPREFVDAYRRARWPTGFLAAFTGSWRFAALRRGSGRLLRQLLRR
jgi:FMN phosphatase YigB (HAD superfamily)